MSDDFIIIDLVVVVVVRVNGWCHAAFGFGGARAYGSNSR